MKRAWAVTGAAFAMAAVVFAWAPLPAALSEPFALACAGLALTLSARSAALRRRSGVGGEAEPAEPNRATA